ncbi:hypothetical protein EHW99_0537 [Erwinia amylovora]|nr:hypothetical protein EHX00_0537 [Erwinia amylovora]QJQ56942.1 hypothetical protein EHW99_0537 [Erwinia amylovora]QJQ60641.1 hypothetical protein EHW98_0537 [Erwinia amylovora]QJQ64443.1 hypothetical protein EHW96_0537 [Erwinia amylovora]QJQ68142.1 hypothetical protein EGZ89_0537 [Erwinia amylovora]
MPFSPFAFGAPVTACDRTWPFAPAVRWQFGVMRQARRRRSAASHRCTESMKICAHRTKTGIALCWRAYGPIRDGNAQALRPNRACQQLPRWVVLKACQSRG